MRLIVLIAWLGFSSAAVWAAEQSSVPLMYDTEALAAWRTLAETEVVPFQVERLGSELLFGTRSQRGSYAFITRIDNTLRRPALVAEEVEALISVDSFAALSPASFQTELGNAELEKDDRLRCVVSSFQTRKLGYDVGAGAGMALVKTVFLPVVLWNRESDSYSNSLYIANFRGDTKHVQDLADFDRMWSHLSIPEGLSLVEIRRFNALQPELAARRSPTPTEEKGGIVKGGIHPAVKDTQEADDEDPSVLAAALLDRLTNRETEATRRRLRKVALEHPGTALAEVISTLDAVRIFELQRAIWLKMLASAEPRTKAHLVALFLSQSINLQDWRAAEALASDAAAASVSLASFEPGDLGLVFDSLFRLQGGAPSNPSLRQLLTLDDPAVFNRLHSLLAGKGFTVPDLEELATQNHKGTWHLKELPARGVPRVAVESGRLVLLRPGSEARKAPLQVKELTNLLELAEALR